MSTTVLPPNAPPLTDPAPSRRVGPWAVIGLVLSLVAIVVGTGAMASAFLRSATQERVSFEGVRTVVLDMDNGDVRLVQAQTDVAVVETSLWWSLRKPSYSARLEGDELVVRAGCRFEIGWGCDVETTVQVPDGVPVTVRSGSGDVRASGLSAGLTLRTGSGELAAQNVRGDVLLRSGSGDVTSVGVDGAIDVQTGSGDVTVIGASEEVVARSGSGDVRVQLSTSARRVQARTGSGDVTVLVPADRGVAYAVQDSSGSGDRYVGVRTDPDSSRSIVVQSGSGDLLVDYLPRVPDPPAAPPAVPTAVPAPS